MGSDSTHSPPLWRPRPLPFPQGDPGPSPSPRETPAPCWQVSRHPSHQTDTFQAASLFPSHDTVVSNLILPRWSEQSSRPDRGVDAAFVHIPGYLMDRDVAEGTCRGNRIGWLPRCPPWAAGPQPAWAAVLVRVRPRTPTLRRQSGGERALHGCLNRERPPPSLLIQVPPSDVHIYSRGLHIPCPELNTEGHWTQGGREEWWAGPSPSEERGPGTLVALHGQGRVASNTPQQREAPTLLPPLGGCGTQTP